MVGAPLARSQPLLLLRLLMLMLMLMLMHAWCMELGMEQGQGVFCGALGLV